MLIVFRKRLLIVICAVLAFLVLSASVTAAVTVFTPRPKFIVVLDPGHGGLDRGVVGVNSKTPESEMNLLLAEKIKKLLEKQGVDVVLTRTDGNGLYGEKDDNMKRADMKKRKEIIHAAMPSVVVSIHCNKFPDKTRRGAQAFFDNRSEKGESLAKLLQTSVNTLNAKYVEREFPALKGDYYILKCSTYPSAIMECGFLSNPEDDMLLNTINYQNELSEAIAKGIVAFLINVE